MTEMDVDAVCHEAQHSLSADDAACLQFSRGFEKKDVPSGKGYIRLTPQPNVT